MFYAVLLWTEIRQIRADYFFFLSEKQMPLASSNCICSSEVASGSVMHLTKYPFSQWITGFLCFQLVTNVLCNACPEKLWKILHTLWIRMANLTLMEPGAGCPLYAPHLGNAIHFSINCCQVTLCLVCTVNGEKETPHLHILTCS